MTSPHPSEDHDHFDTALGVQHREVADRPEAATDLQHRRRIADGESRSGPIYGVMFGVFGATLAFFVVAMLVGVRRRQRR